MSSSPGYKRFDPHPYVVFQGTPGIAGKPHEEYGSYRTSQDLGSKRLTQKNWMRLPSGVVKHSNGNPLEMEVSSWENV